MSNESELTKVWSVDSTGSIFSPIFQISPTIPPGMYHVFTNHRGEIYFSKLNPPSDVYVELPDRLTEEILQDLQVFWDSRQKYKDIGHTHKRGVLLYGPPGGGKTTTIRGIVNDVIERNGIVINFDTSPQDILKAISALRKMFSSDNSIPLLVVLEDIDHLINEYSEKDVLALLDGETQTDNVIFLATTNYPEKLSERLIRRPGRFDSIIYLGAPSPENRKKYIESNLERLSEKDRPDINIDKWVKDTEGLSIPHIKEMFISIVILGKDYEFILKGVKDIKNRQRKSKENENGEISFGFRK
jgi:SpoVK/Ycf46/Vps4 family AAA+-type ATPase